MAENDEDMNPKQKIQKSKEWVEEKIRFAIKHFETFTGVRIQKIDYYYEDGAFLDEENRPNHLDIILEDL